MTTTTISQPSAEFLSAWARLSFTSKAGLMAMYLEDKLRPGLDPFRFATVLLSEASDDRGQFEVRGMYTRTGNPLPFSMEVDD